MGSVRERDRLFQGQKMIEDLIQSAVSQLENQFLSGGLILMALGALLAYMRRVPQIIWSGIKRQLFITLDVTDDDVAFEWLKLFLDQNESLKRARFLTVSVSDDIETETEASSEPSANTAESGIASLKRRVVFTPAPGVHFFFYRGRPVLLVRNREKAEGGRGKRFLESMTLTIPGRSRAILDKLLGDALEVVFSNKDSSPRVFVSIFGSWRRLSGFSHRNIDSVDLPAGQMDFLLSDVRGFLGKKQEYARRGIPYHRGYLFSGIAGTGKTATISALAGELGLNLYVLNLAGFGMTDEALFGLVFEITKHGVILLEDIDTVAPTREPVSGGELMKVSLYGLLNCLDGVMAKNGSIVFMTTNHKDKLDAALIRPGRVDVELEFGYATMDQIESMYRRLKPFANDEVVGDFVGSFSGVPVTMAEVQQRILQTRDKLVLVAKEGGLVRVEQK